MKNLTTYLFVMLMAMFWVFRIVVAMCYSLGVSFITVPIDLNFEIVLLFLTFVSMILIIKRSMFGSLLYLIGNGLYFGYNIYGLLIAISGGATLQHYTDLMFALIGVGLPLLILFDTLLDRNRKAHPVDKKTDWFYKNKKYEREKDERADKNEYRIL